MADGVELGTAFVSIIPEVSKIGTIIKDALMGAGQDAEVAGKHLGERMGFSLMGALKDPIGQVKGSLEHMGDAAKESSDGAFGIKAGALLAAGGVAAIGAAALEVGHQLYEMGHAWDEISDNMITKFGATKEEAEKLTDQVG